MSGAEYCLGCSFYEDGEHCPQPPAYYMELRDCTACREVGLPRCSGHRACTVHAAEARADEYLFDADDADIIVERIRSWAPAGAS